MVVLLHSQRFRVWWGDKFSVLADPRRGFPGRGLGARSHSPVRKRGPMLGSCDGYCVGSYSNLESSAPRRENASGVPILERSMGWVVEMV